MRGRGSLSVDFEAEPARPSAWCEPLTPAPSRASHDPHPGCRLFRSGARLLVIILSLVAAVPALSQNLEPRSYTNLPVGLNFLVAGLARSRGDLSPVPSSPLQDAELTIDVGLVGYGRSFAIAGKSAKFDVGVARTCYEGSATFRGEFVEGRRCENLDPLVRLNWNFYGAPAMSREAFRSWIPGLVIGASLQVSAPLGSYDSDQLINAGTNRWMIHPGVGLSYQSGPWLYEAMASVKIFEDNDDFFGGIYLEQDPLYLMQGHLTYNFPRGSWLSVNANFFRGGETTKDGVKADDYMENSRFGLTFSMPLNVQHSIKLYYNSGVITRVGNDFNSYGASWLYMF